MNKKSQFLMEVMIVKSVTQRIKEIKQPRGGYVNPRLFDEIKLDESEQLNEQENIHASLVGIAVDYLTRYTFGANVKDAFRISFLGSKIINADFIADSLSYKIQGLDNISIISACKLVGFDVCFRSSIAGYRPVEDILPDQGTIDNIRMMVNRSVKFFEKYGPITKDGFTFEGAYTNVVSTGDGDFLTFDTLWDFKVSKSKPTSAHTLQLLMYYLMGKRSIHEEFNTIHKIGVYNPRLNSVYLLDISDISADVINLVETEVIGY
jgi:hypothetical protein